MLRTGPMGDAMPPFTSHVPISFVSDLYLHLSVLAGVGHNHRQERRNCKIGLGEQEGNNNITYLCCLNDYLTTWHLELSSSPCRHS